jgi:hypothetical protein
MTGGAPAFELARRWAWAAGWCTITATDTLTRARALAGRRLALLGRALAPRLTPP